MRLFRISTIIGLALAFSGVAASASAQTTICDGVLSGAFHSVFVPAGRPCSMHDATVEQSIVVSEWAQLQLVGNVTVDGNISASGAASVQALTTAAGSNTVRGNIMVVGTDYVRICGTQIGGNVLVIETANRGAVGTFSLVAFGGEQAGSVCQSVGGGNTVTSGNVRIDSNDVTFFRVADNVVAGNMTISGNTGVAAKRVLNNQVGLRLTCRDNVEPLLADGNTAAKLIGQCEP
jgi:hypothetical protein